MIEIDSSQARWQHTRTQQILLQRAAETDDNIIVSQKEITQVQNESTVTVSKVSSWAKEKNMVDVENPPDDVATAVDTTATTDTSERESSGVGGMSGKRKFALAFVAIAVVAGLSLGLVFGLRENGGGSNEPESITESNVDNNEDETTLLTNNEGKTFYPGDGILPVPNNEALEESVTTANVIPELDVLPKPEESVQYYRSEGPLLAQVRIISPSVANGYETCSDLEKDIAEVLKHYTNQVIMEQSMSGEMYAECDPSNPNWYWDSYRNEYGYDYPRPCFHYDDDSGCADDDWEDGSDYYYHGQNYYHYENEDGAVWSENENEDGVLYEEAILLPAKIDMKSVRNNAPPPKKRNGNPSSKNHNKRNGNPSPNNRQSGPEAQKSATSEDSFYANNQVDGVDSADIVKSDGKNVFAAYGDILYAWDAKNGTAGTSITTMPGNATECNNYYNNWNYNEEEEYWYGEDGEVEYSYGNDDWSHTDPTTPSEGIDAANVSSPQKKRHHKPNKQRARRAEDHEPYYSGPQSEPCTYVSKPQVQALLLSGNRLTAIVVQSSYLYTYPENYTEPIVSDYSILTVRVYDIDNVPIDGSPLKEIGSKELNGDFFNGRSVGDTALIVTNSYINTYSIANDMQRYLPQYCGLNTSDYIKQAAETAAKNDFDALAKQIMGELQLENDCSHIFQISMMQEANNNSTTSETGNDMPDLTGGNLMNQFVSIVTFNMSADFGADGVISPHLSGTFSPGGAYMASLYVTEDFVVTVNNGWSYDYNTGESYSNTYVLGFNTTSGVALPYCVGNVPGTIVNEHSISKRGEYLRVATSEWNWNANSFNSTTSNKIFVLKIPDEKDGAVMKVVGETSHLGKDGESIYAVRFFEDMGYVVTFEHIDPFIVVDLSDETNPQSVGELEVPGFSTYLHPVEIDGDRFILSIGEEWDENEWWSSVKLTLFNVSDPSSPVVAAELLDKGASTNAQYDFQAVRYMPESKSLIIPKSKYNYDTYGDGSEGFVVYEVSADKIKPLYNISQSDNNCWYESYIQPRSLVFESKLTTIIGHTVLSTDLDSGDMVWELDLDVGLNRSCSNDYSYNYRNDYFYDGESYASDDGFGDLFGNMTDSPLAVCMMSDEWSSCCDDPEVEDLTVALWCKGMECMDERTGILLTEACGCNDMVGACEDAYASGFGDGSPLSMIMMGMCEGFQDCCVANVTTNDDFNSCMEESDVGMGGGMFDDIFRG